MAASKEYNRLGKLIKESKDRTPLWQAKVSSCMHFDDGNHRLYFDMNGRPRSRGLRDNEVHRTVNKFPQTLSRISARMTATQPRWNPVPSELADVTDDEIDAADAMLQDLWEGDEFGDNALRTAAKFVARQAFLQGRYLTYYTFDKEVNMPVMECYSLWDVFSDAPESLKDKQWLIIALPTSVQKIKHNKEYDAKVRSKARADGKLAESGLQQQFDRRSTGTNNSMQDTQILYHSFEVIKKGEDEEKKGEELGDDASLAKIKKEDKAKTVIKYKVTSERGVLIEKELDYPRLSSIFDSYAPEEKGVFYASPVAYSWIDMQKGINKTISNIEAYIDNMLQGKWIIRDDGVSIPVAGRQGQKIKDPSGSGVANLPMQPLPQTHFQHLQVMERSFEDASGVAEASISRVAGIGDSGKAIEQLQQINQMSTSDPIDNFQMFLSRAAKKLLRQAADNWSEVHTLYRYDKGTGENIPIHLIGEGFANEDPEDVTQERDGEKPTKLRAFKRIDVEIELDQLFRKNQERVEVKELFQMGWIPGANPVWDIVVMNAYRIGSGKKIVKELKKLQNPIALAAEANAQRMVQGEEIPINGTDPHEFFAQFYEQRAKEMLQAGNQEGATLLNGQAQRHRIIAQQGDGGAGDPNVPEDLAGLEEGQGL